MQTPTITVRALAGTVAVTIPGYSARTLRVALRTAAEVCEAVAGANAELVSYLGEIPSFRFERGKLDSCTVVHFDAPRLAAPAVLAEVVATVAAAARVATRRREWRVVGLDDVGRVAVEL